jgi:hypothetical protein
MEKFQFNLLKAVFSDLFRFVLRVDIPRAVVLKTLYKISAGFEARDARGKLLNLACFGTDLAWLLEAATDIAPPFFVLAGLNNPIEDFRFTGEKLDELAILAKEDLVAWQALQELLDELKQQDALPKSLSPSEVLEFIHDKPQGNPGQHPLLNRHRNALIIMLMEGALESGLTPMSRSPTSGTLSVCDAAVDALNGLKEIQQHFDHGTIKTIWDRRQSLVDQKLGEFRIDIPASSKNAQQKNIYIGFRRLDF